MLLPPQGILRESYCCCYCFVLAHIFLKVFEAGASKFLSLPKAICYESRKGTIPKYFATSKKIFRIDIFFENRKQFTIQESFQNPEHFRKSRKILCHLTLAPVVSTLSRYTHRAALGCTRSTANYVSFALSLLGHLQ